MTRNYANEGRKDFNLVSFGCSKEQGTRDAEEKLQTLEVEMGHRISQEARFSSMFIAAPVKGKLGIHMVQGPMDCRIAGFQIQMPYHYTTSLCASDKHILEMILGAFFGINCIRIWGVEV
jgi:hypothetical protein